jgi:membrane fusion protein (multidrug efflux system)
VVAVSLLLSGCSDAPPQQSDHKAKQQSKQPAKEVGIHTLKIQKVATELALPARVEAFSTAEIRPQVSGIVQSINFKQGSFVEEGQQLYQIDPTPFEASVQMAEANLQNAEAELAVVKTNEERLSALVITNAVSKQEFDEVQASRKQAAAAVAMAQAEVDNANINLEYT